MYMNNAFSFQIVMDFPFICFARNFLLNIPIAVKPYISFHLKY